ncbi:MAG: SDR family oxidoreductase, partial [Myxococcota bacterium]
LARELVAQLSARDREVFVLTEDEELPLPPSTRRLVGRPGSLDFGLSGAEVRQLAERPLVLHDAVAPVGLTPARDAVQLPVAAARETLELSEAFTRLERAVFWSTAAVSGTRSGLIREDDAQAPSAFHDPASEGWCRAEALAQEARSTVPLTVLRPALLVGPSRTGAMDPGAPARALLERLLDAPGDLGLPLPARGEQPLPVVPVDYAVRAGLLLLESPVTLGGTYHVLDPHPPTLREAFETFAKLTGRRMLRAELPSAVASVAVRGLAPGARGFLDQLLNDAEWDGRRARPHLEHLDAPRFDEWAPRLVDHVRAARG